MNAAAGTTLVCRSCGGASLTPILSLGRQPLANALLASEQLDCDERRYPLDLVYCPGCHLLQITETIPPEILFREYFYFSSFSDTFLQHAEDLVRRMVQERRLGAGSLVLEAASNDGYLLQYYKRAGVPVLGIEPARNVAERARTERGVDTLAEFFGRDLAFRLRAEGRRADVLHAHNVLAHVADLDGFVAGIGLALKDDGVAVIEVPYVRDMVDRCEFDTIYHEHLCYFSLTALSRLFARNGLATERVERLPVHGGSLRLFVSAAGRPADRTVADLLAEEAAVGVDQLHYYQSFSERVVRLQARLTEQLRTLRGSGSTIAAYGAAAKGVVLLNSIGDAASLLDFVVDRSPYKQGRHLPGVRLPVLAPEALLERRPDYVLLLAWNLADEIVAQQSEYRRRGGRFIVPVPEPRIL